MSGGAGTGIRVLWLLALSALGGALCKSHPEKVHLGPTSCDSVTVSLGVVGLPSGNSEHSEPGLLSPPAQQHESSMTGRPQEKPPEPGPHLNQLLQKSRCEQHLFTTVAFGPSLSPGEDVKPLALHMRGRGQQEHLAAATVTDMSAVE
ncbi:hypothetical protein AB1E18_016908 [Capra hircus]